MITSFYSCLCCEARPVFPNPYSFQFGPKSYEQNKKNFQGNEIKTTKYNLVNFLPKAIISQYQRLANFYFLMVAIISTIPDATPLNPAFIWTPLAIVLTISIIKQMYEDYSRYKMDQQVNDIKQIAVMRGGRLQKIKWKNLTVGDICLIKQQEIFPADLLLISSSANDGVAYIETASLDGEQTSKIRYAFQELNASNRDHIKNQIEGAFEGDTPNASLSQFRATLVVNNKRFGISDCSQLLFRGTKLKNTEWVWGLVVYTGQCSKIMMNGQSFVTKLSTVEKKLNYLLVAILIAQLLICLLMAWLSTEKEIQMRMNQHYSIWRQYSRNRLFIMNFLLFFVEYSSFIPISLIISIEVVKTVQSYFIDFDQLMFSSWRNKKVYARTAALNQQLGQVEYVFCDKTGTLTKNQLKFHTAIIGNQSFQFQYKKQSKFYDNSDQSFLQLLNNRDDETYMLQRELKLINKDIFKDISTFSSLMHEYLMCLLVCNNINIIEGQNDEIIYQSQSPDELALIELAKNYQYIFLKRQKNSIQVKIQGKVHRIQVLARFGFTSDRKRMSVIIKWQKYYILYCKGADNVIFERSKLSSFNIAKSISRLSSSGLRSLLVAVRLIHPSEIEQFLVELSEAASAQRQFVMDNYAKRFQDDLSILGATGLLDELQSEVPQALRDLQRAEIKVWMLTGDKLETAIQIGKSCNLIEPSYDLTILKSTAEQTIEQLIRKCRVQTQLSSKKKCLVVEGSVLAQILNNSQIQRQFSQLTLDFTSVICCRMLPVQKSQAVRMIKTHLKKICLAVGDGGNDVSMIKQANIGVGIYGQQGMNAVQASDYAIPEFKMLWRLLFVHGRWNYIRISEMILYFCYKSILFTIPRMLFSFSNAYSGQPIYDDFYIALYNILFTSLPLLVRALFEQDINYIKPQSDQDKNNKQNQIQQSEHLPNGHVIHYGLRRLFPKIYFLGQKNQIFNIQQCLLWIVQAILMGFSLFFIIKRVFETQSIVDHGYNSNLQLVSVTVYTSIIMLSTLKLCIQVRHWTKLLLLTIIFLSIVPYFGFVWLLNYYFKRPVQGIMYIYFTSTKTYFSILLLVLILVGMNGILVYFKFYSHKIISKMVFAWKQGAQLDSLISKKEENLPAIVETESIMKEKKGRQIEECIVVEVKPKLNMDSSEHL